LIAPLLALALTGTQPAHEDAAEAIARGDAEYERRAEGASGELARPEIADAALREYQLALTLDPRSLEARAKLLRGLFFRSTFCGAAEPDKRSLYEEAKRVADAGLDALEARLGRPKGDARLAALGKQEGSAALHFWAAVSWGQWALAQSKLTALRSGAAGRIRDLAQTVIDLDPELQQGGGDYLLGRVHDQCPWIPFLTGWVSKQKALQHLRRALAIGPANSVNRYFLAEAILRHQGEHADGARRLLQLCIDTPPRETFWVEDIHYQEMSRKLLAEIR
jgi:tetratricopeptide (TPR) repeat protein